MGIVRQYANTVYAPGVKVSKAGNRTLFGLVEDQIAAVTLGLTGYLTWDELSSVTGGVNHQMAIVAASDLGSHVDPVSEEVVRNAGYYRWNAEETAWEWLALSSIAGGVEVSCSITVGTGVDAGVWIFTPLPGQPEVHPSGLGQTYSGFIPVSVDGFSAKVAGVDADARPAAFQNGDYATTGTLFATEYVRICYREGGQIQILDPSPAPPNGSLGRVFLGMELIARDGNNLHVEPIGGVDHPNTTGADYFCVLALPDDFEPGEGGWTIATAGITMDPISLTYLDGTDIEPSRASGKDVLMWSRPGGAGTYKLYQLWKPDDAKPGGGGAAATEYDRVQAGWAMRNAHAARILGQRNTDLLAGNLTHLGGLTGAANTIAYFTGADAMAVTALTAQARDLLAATSFGAMRALLSLVPGTDVQGYNGNLTAFGGLSLIADRLPFANGTGTLSLATFTAAGRALVDDADAPAQRTTLGLGSIATQAANAVVITGGTAFGLGGLQVTGTTSPSSGSGLEIQGGSSVVFQAYNRTGGTYINFTIDAMQVSLRPGGSAKLVANTTQVVISGSLKLPSYTVSTVPSASAHGAGSDIYVSDESGGAVPAFSDGTNWRRVTDRAIIS